ncbi:MocR-like pyridoxine biosynthesis transcription factor PdxR [Brevibacillus sp. FSL L8-0710]|uniref:MocR-like pyridoxine biosynthesis transcription factor PdxR n=1 Tax=Brevibacillus sp. FSL L8-0710 TaxID=2975313 RepID=UPI0030FC2D33
MEIHPNWTKAGSGKLYLQLYAYFREEIQTRRILPGTRLPSVRSISRNLQLSKTTVETAYHQLLAEGYIESRERSGFYVVEWEEDEVAVPPGKHGGKAAANGAMNEIGNTAGHAAEAEPAGVGYRVGAEDTAGAGHTAGVGHTAGAKHAAAHTLPGTGTTPLPEKAIAKSDTAGPPAGKNPNILYDFHQARVDAEHFPYGLWRKYSNQCMRPENRNILNYGNRQGERALREEIARYLQRARGVACTPDQIVIGAGTQVLVQVLCFLLTLEERVVAMEEPGYDGVRTVFQHLGYKIAPIPLDEDGIDVEVLEASGATLIYITPSHQEPTGAVMPYARRIRLLQWAARSGAYIIEDDYDGEFRYQTKPIPSLQGLDTHERVIYLGTFSKSLLPSIRMSYMVLPPALLQIYGSQLYEYDQTASRIHQETLALFMKSGEWERHIRKMRTLYSKKHEAMLKSLHTYFGERIHVTGQNAGLSVTVEAVSDLSAEELAQHALSVGIRVYPTTRKWLHQPKDSLPAFQFGFGGMSAEAIEQGICLLEEVWKPYLTSHERD